MASSGHQHVDTSGFPTLPWPHLVGQLPNVTSRKIKLALPCIGLDALWWGLQEAGVTKFIGNSKRARRTSGYPCTRSIDSGLLFDERACTIGERAQSGLVMASGGGHNAGSGNGCFPNRRRGKGAPAGARKAGTTVDIGVGTSTISPPQPYFGTLADLPPAERFDPMSRELKPEDLTWEMIARNCTQWPRATPDVVQFAVARFSTTQIVPWLRRNSIAIEAYDRYLPELDTWLQGNIAPAIAGLTEQRRLTDIAIEARIGRLEGRVETLTKIVAAQSTGRGSTPFSYQDDIQERISHAQRVAAISRGHSPAPSHASSASRRRPDPGFEMAMQMPASPAHSFTPSVSGVLDALQAHNNP